MNNFKKIEVQASNGIAIVGPGNTLKTLVEGLHTEEARFMLYGSSPSVELAAIPRLAASATTRMHGATDKCPKGVIRVHVRGLDNLTGLSIGVKYASSFQLGSYSQIDRECNFPPDLKRVYSCIT